MARGHKYQLENSNWQGNWTNQFDATSDYHH